jgi:hypothetical protein
MLFATLITLVQNLSKFLHCLLILEFRFSQVAESKMHDVDEKLDELETIISIFEQKLDSLPSELFSDLP